MRRRRNSLQPDTFPFLAVLLGAMGSLILILMIFDRRARQAAVEKNHQAQAEQQQRLHDSQPTMPPGDPEERKARLAAFVERQTLLRGEEARVRQQQQAVAERIVTTQKGTAAEQQRRQHAEEALRSEQQRLQQALRDAEARQGDLKQTTGAAKAAQAKVQQLATELARAEEALKRLLEQKAREEQTWSIVPYVGKRGQNQRPLYVECDGHGFTFHPDKRKLMGIDAISDGLRKEIEARTAKARTERPGREVYWMVLVRPDGIDNYYGFQAATKGLDVAFGYELIDDDWALEFPEPPNDTVTVPPAPPRPARPTGGGPVAVGAGQPGGSNVPGGQGGQGPGGGGPQGTGQPGISGVRVLPPVGGSGGPGGGSPGSGAVGVRAGTGTPNSAVTLPGQGADGRPGPAVGVVGGQSGGGSSQGASGDGPPGPFHGGIGQGVPATAVGGPGGGTMTSPGSPTFPGGETGEGAQGSTSAHSGEGTGSVGPPPRPGGSVGTGTGGTPGTPGGTGGGEPGTTPPPPSPRAQGGTGGSSGSSHKQGTPSEGDEGPSGGGHGMGGTVDGLPGPKKPKPKILKPARVSPNPDWVIEVICQGTGVSVPGGHITLTLGELNPDGAALAARIERWITERQATVRTGEPAYRPQIHFVVRPDGQRTFHLAYPALERLHVPMRTVLHQDEDEE